MTDSLELWFILNKLNLFFVNCLILFFKVTLYFNHNLVSKQCKMTKEEVQQSIPYLYHSLLFQPECRINDDLKFFTHVQYINRMQNR